MQPVGEFKNGGRTKRPKGDPLLAKVHDFPSQAQAKAKHDGVYDRGQNRGFVNMGTSHDTPASAIESIRPWNRGHLMLGWLGWVRQGSSWGVLPLSHGLGGEDGRVRAIGGRGFGASRAQVGRQGGFSPVAVGGPGGRAGVVAAGAVSGLQAVQGDHLRADQRPPSGLAALQAEQRLPGGIPRVAERRDLDGHVRGCATRYASPARRVRWSGESARSRAATSAGAFSVPSANGQGLETTCSSTLARALGSRA